MGGIKRAFFSLAAFTYAGTTLASPWPVGVVDNVEAIKNYPVSLEVLRNDIGDELRIKNANESSTAWGRITISKDKKSLTYTPRYDYTGTDEFWYVLEDKQGRTNAAKVTISVSPDNGWPQATNDAVTAV